MKRKKSEKKLMLAKITVCRLNNLEMSAALGGDRTCPPTSIDPENCTTYQPNTSDITTTVP